MGEPRVQRSSDVSGVRDNEETRHWFPNNGKSLPEWDKVGLLKEGHKIDVLGILVN